MPREMYPLWCGAPMGFGLSATIAQEIQNVATETRAKLPPTRRLYPGRRVPARLPLWGSIVDDFWVLFLRRLRRAARKGLPLRWTHRVVDAWGSLGIAWA